MIVVSGTITIDPAKHDRMVELLSALVPATQAEAGNVTYGFYQGPEGGGEWRIFEEWESEDALNAHMVSPHMAEFMGSMGDVGVTGAELSRYDVSAKSKLM
ncbi:MAG TPA: putative quinol monooxygenase [Microthrixaceae bacterium]|nr:putative quinol monooxygenase [Microthrixaceae bacterium]